MKKLNRLILASIFFVFSGSLAAETVELETGERRIAQATYLQGDNDANPVLILHGFLQTREFPTVNRLANSLNEAGYTVLAPTLTLGLNKRKKSLACEAIHTHNTNSDTAEIVQWVNWLSEKTGKTVTVIGHSAGSQTLLGYMSNYENKKLDKAIFISMSYFAQGPSAHETPELAQRAQKNLEQGYNSMDTYAMSFCKTYPTRASDFLSYYEWDRKKVAGIATEYADIINVIIGTGDQRIDADWKEQLKQNSISVIEIEGANHFFDQAHEFDLLDAIENLLGDSEA